MKSIKGSLFLASFFFVAIQLSAQVKQVYTHVVQGRKSFELNQEVHLKRDDFKFVMQMARPSSVLISCSTDDVTLKQALQGKKLEEMKGFQGTGMAEALFNPDKEILFDNENASCWYYDSLPSHRFNEAYWDNGGIKCERKIKQLYDVANGKEISLKDAPKLYLVIVEYQAIPGSIEFIEVSREWLVIVWE
jgi:hypothetical protein